MDGQSQGHGLEEAEAVGGAQEVLAGAVGMGHHAEDVAAFAEDAGDVFERAVGVVGGLGGTFDRGVAEGDAVLALELGEGGSSQK